MSYNKDLPAGTYKAHALGAGAYESQRGALMIGIQWEIAEGPFAGCQITSHDCLVTTAGVVCEKKIGMIKEWAQGWDGVDTDWFSEHYPEFDVELVVVRELYNGEDRPAVKYVNAPGVSHGIIPTGDADTLKAKFGARLRALAGAQPRPVGEQTNARAPAKKTPASDPMEDRNAAWGMFVKRHNFENSDAASTAWYDMIARVLPGRTNYADFTPADWKKVRAAVEAEAKVHRTVSDLPF